MNSILLKPEFKDRIIAYGKSALPLGQRDDLADLLILSYEANRSDYIDMFQDPPTLAELKGEKVDAILQQLPINQETDKNEEIN
jgi:hypothetical protein